MKRIILLFIFCITARPIYSNQCLTIDHVWALVMNNHEQVKSLYLENYQAGLQIRQTLARLFPCIGASAAITFSNPSKEVEGSRIIPSNFKTGRLTLTQSIIDLRLKPCYRSAKLAKEATCHRTEFEIYELLYFASETYLAVLQAKDLLLVSENQLALVEEQYRMIQERYERGEVPITDLLRSEEEVNRAKRVVNDIRSDVLVYQEQLSNLTNLEICNCQLVAPVFAEEECQYDLDSLLQEACRRRHDLQSLSLAIEAARQQIIALKRTNWPRVDFLGEYTLASPETLAFRNNSWSAGFCLNMPLFDGGTNRLAVKNAEAEMTKQELLYSRMVKDLRVQVKSAYYDLTSALANCSLLRTELDLAKENYEIISQRYIRGQTTNIDLMDGLNALIQIQANYAIAQYNLILLHLRLKKETGFFEEIIQKAPCGEC